ncbi:MAG: hypothetical protein GY943_04575 [Chloroflexi bacterium]|nr:hypothetical protein [Chloroflexota bacterium]
MCNLSKRFLFAWLMLGISISCLFVVPQVVAQITDPVSEILVVGGEIANGTTGQPLTDPVEVTLHAFNRSYTATDTMTTIVESNGRFTFPLTNNPPDWVYMTSVRYKDLEFTSDIGKLTEATSSLQLPITVYEPTRDPNVIAIDQLHVSLTFLEGEVEVNELYTFDNRGTAVYVGTTGDLTNGSVQITLPDNAIDPQFERGLGPNSGFFPANDLLQQEGRWYDTYALRPGSTSLTLLVTYRLPYQAALTLSHSLPYQTETVLVALPDNGITFQSAGWQQEASRSTGTDTVIRSFSRTGFAAGEALQIGVNGRLSSTSTTIATQTQSTTDWLLSGIILFIAVGMVGRLFWRRRSSRVEAELEIEDEVESRHVSVQMNAEQETAVRCRQLLVALATLDEAYSCGDIVDPHYTNRRHQLKAELKLIWKPAPQSQQANHPDETKVPAHILEM